MRPAVRKPFRLVDAMVLVAAMAVAFAIFRNGPGSSISFNTFGGNIEQWIFYWMHQLIPFPAMLSLAVVLIARFDRREGRRRTPRHAGVIACYAAVVALAVSSLVASTFYSLHILEENGLIPHLFSHNRQMHQPPPFGGAPMEEIVGAAVLGAWGTLLASGRWRAERSWIDRSGRLLGLAWIALFLTYLYAYTG